MLPARFYGTIFHVKFSKGEKKSNEPMPCILITGKDSFTVISENWEKSVCRVSLKKVVSMDKMPDAVKVTFKADNSAVSIILETPKIEKLMHAITPDGPDHQLPILFNTLKSIIPTLGFSDKQKENFLQNITGVFSVFFSKFECAKPYQITFCDLLIVLYRFRFKTEEKMNEKGKMETILKELNRQWADEWLKSICSAAEFDPTQSNGYEYALRIVLGLGDDLYNHQSYMVGDPKSLFVAITEMNEKRDATNITEAAKQLLIQSETETTNEYKVNATLNDKFCLLVKRMLILAFCGNMVQVLPIDIERITCRTIDLACAVMDEHLVDDHFHLLRKAVDSYGHELLRFMNTRRYDPSFKYVYACYVVSREICRMKI